MRRSSSEPEADRDSGPPVLRKPYTKPELVTYGNVAQLTETGGGSTSDGTGNRRRMG